MFGSTASAQLALPTLATTDKGIVIGKLVGQTRQFLGVPYAAPPVGNLRWKAPAPERLYGLRDATRFANHCAQPASPF
ncbi:MAG TPA: carboxylesterase family protein, partial [Polyangiales bacterium]|nr:carboxylesterase family protein [Polyangiales bacterium]